MEQFEWSESGKVLRNKIDQIIANHGGIESYTLLVEAELSNTKHQRDRIRMNDAFTLVEKHGMIYQDGADLLGLSRNEFIKRYKAFKEQTDTNKPTNKP